MGHARSALVALWVVSMAALATAASNESDDGDHRQALSTIVNANTSIVQALSLAEAHAGGHTMAIELGLEGETSVYEIKLVSRDGVTIVFVDPVGGRVMRAESAGVIERLLEWPDRARFAELTASTIRLVGAIRAAERETGGTAIEAKFERDDGSMLFAVAVARNGTLLDVEVDAATSAVREISADSDD